MTVCSLCGRAPDDVSPSDDADAGEVPLTWVSSFENGRLRFYCDQCARQYLRSIESKLDSEFWG